MLKTIKAVRPILSCQERKEVTNTHFMKTPPINLGNLPPMTIYEV